jgi:hypothetical protein
LTALCHGSPPQVVAAAIAPRLATEGPGQSNAMRLPPSRPGVDV